MGRGGPSRVLDPARDAALLDFPGVFRYALCPHVAQGHISVGVREVKRLVLAHWPWFDCHVSAGHGGLRDFFKVEFGEHDCSPVKKPALWHRVQALTVDVARARFVSGLRGWPQLAYETSPRA